MFSTDNHLEHPVSGEAGLTTPRAAAVVVLSALVLLILIRRGFHGVSALGVSVAVK